MSTSQAAPTVSSYHELCACASGSSQDKKCPRVHLPPPEQPPPPALEPWPFHHCSHPCPALTCLHLGKGERRAEGAIGGSACLLWFWEV